MRTKITVKAEIILSEDEFTNLTTIVMDEMKRLDDEMEENTEYAKFLEKIFEFV